MGEKVNLVNKLETILGFDVPGEAARVGAHACIVAENVQRAASVQPALRKCVDALDLAHINLPPLNGALLVASRSRKGFAVVCDSAGMLLSGGDAAGQEQVRAALGKVQSSLLADAAIGSRDDDPFSAQVRKGHILLSDGRAVSALPEALVAAPEPGWLGER